MDDFTTRLQLNITFLTVLISFSLFLKSLLNHLLFKPQCPRHGYILYVWYFELQFFFFNLIRIGDGISKFDHQIHAQNLNWSSCVSDINLHSLGRHSRFLIYLNFLADRYKNIILSLYNILTLFILQKTDVEEDVKCYNSPRLPYK